MENKLIALTKSFEDESIRTVWNKEEEKYYISMVDIIKVLIDCDYQQARNNWKVIKFRLKEEGNETVTNCNQLRLKATDGKMRMTDVVNIEGMLRIIESIPSKKEEVFFTK